RPFFGTYFPRKAADWIARADDEAEMVCHINEGDLEQLIRNGRGFLLLGPPLSGKTFTLFQILRKMLGYTVISPDGSQPVPDEETFKHLTGRKVVILLDNLAALPADYDLTLFCGR